MTSFLILKEITSRDSDGNPTAFNSIPYLCKYTHDRNKINSFVRNFSELSEEDLGINNTYTVLVTIKAFYGIEIPDNNKYICRFNGKDFQILLNKHDLQTRQLQLLLKLYREDDTDRQFGAYL